MSVALLVNYITLVSILNKNGITLAGRHGVMNSVGRKSSLDSRKPLSWIKLKDVRSAIRIILRDIYLSSLFHAFRAVTIVISPFGKSCPYHSKADSTEFQYVDRPKNTSVYPVTASELSRSILVGVFQSKIYLAVFVESAAPRARYCIKHNLLQKILNNLFGVGYRSGNLLLKMAVPIYII